MVDRMFDALHGELVRRQELLRRTGTFASLRDYEKARQGGAPLAPVASLLVVVDEFSELLASKPEFAELFVMIGRLGRSLGVHLLLASQHLDEGRLRGLGSHLSYRIALRTFSAMESRSVIGVADAYELPPSPGHGYLLHDNTTLVRFKAGYVSAPVRAARPEPSAGFAVRQPVGYSTAYVPVPSGAAVSEPDGGERTLLDAVVDRLRGRGPAAHQVWLPPLAEPPTLDALPPAGAALTVPVGVVDRPLDQRRDPLWVELSGSAGHVAVVGAPRSGKSTAAGTLVAALAAGYPPDEVQVYGIELAGGTLSALRALPHVGGVARRQETELVRRTVAELSGMLERREKAFADAGVSTLADYRQAVPAGDCPDVFLVIDGWLTFLQEFDALEPAVGRLATRGLGYGIHLVLTANRWAELRPALRELLGTRLELRLGEPFESETNRRAAANVPERNPGRGITREGLHCLIALPRLDGRPAVDDLAAGMRDLAAQVAAGWTGAGRAAPVRTLPRLLEVSALPAPGGDGLPIGLDEDALAPVLLDFEADPHVVVFGDTESGKTNLLRLIARQVVRRYEPEQARIIIADYRRGLIDAVGTAHQIGYATSAEALDPLMANLVGALRERLPGPGLTTEALRTRSWWHGADLYLLVDDYDLIEGQANPLAALGPLLGHGRDIGLHVIAARACGGASRAQFDPVLRRIREMAGPGILLSGSPEEGALLGKVRPQPQPAGRGVLVSRRHGTRTVQTAYLPDAPA
jgi:S-DNA-T family DNA segregation ATPase FtsK/SpoIIIE